MVHASLMMEILYFILYHTFSKKSRHEHEDGSGGQIRTEVHDTLLKIIIDNPAKKNP